MWHGLYIFQIMILLVCLVTKVLCFDLIIHFQILADAMGLGKTIMTISLLLAHSGRGGLSDSHLMSQRFSESSEDSSLSDRSPSTTEKIKRWSGFDKLMKSRASLMGGGNLIVCPMTLLGQWKVRTGILLSLIDAVYYVSYCSRLFVRLFFFRY